MNTPSSNLSKSDNVHESSHMMRFGNHQVHNWAVYLGLIAALAVLVAVISTLGISYQVTSQTPAPKPPVVLMEKRLKKPVLQAEKQGETAKLIDNLKQYGLWEIEPPQEVSRFFIRSYPADLHTIEDISIRKRVFINSLLPHALYVRQETLFKRSRLESILDKINCFPEDIDFNTRSDAESQCSWSDFLAANEIRFIRNLCKDYRTSTAEELLERVDAIPTSLILAQGALESSWGSSRFTREGNSLFGMWTWKNKGIIPSQREAGKTHRVKVYENVLDSVRSYQLTLNRLGPYDYLRQLRLNTDDPLILAEGLTLYSARGAAYVEDIKNVILSNDLQKYDSCRLSDFDLPEFSTPLLNSLDLAKSGKASL